MMGSTVYILREDKGKAITHIHPLDRGQGRMNKITYRDVLEETYVTWLLLTFLSGRGFLNCHINHRPGFHDQWNR